jgi:hypothetical protein
MPELKEAQDAAISSPPAQPLIWTDDTRSRFVGYIEKWRGLMLMNGWHINVRFSEEPYVDCDGKTDNECSAAMTVNDTYQSGHLIVIYPNMLNQSDFEEQERRVIHEMAHIITHGQKALTRRLFSDKFVTWQEMTNENERATDWIANILANLERLNKP